MTTLIFNKLTVPFLLPLWASITVIGGAKTILIKFYLNILHMLICTINIKVEEINIKAYKPTFYILTRFSRMRGVR